MHTSAKKDKPFLLIVGDNADAGEAMRLYDYLSKVYHVDLEYCGESQRVYTVMPKE